MPPSPSLDTPRLLCYAVRVPLGDGLMEKVRITVMTALLIVLFLAAPTSAAEWGPWSASPEAPAIGLAEPEGTPGGPSPENPVRRFLAGSVRFFQRYISPVDGDRCTMAPTCSHYSLDALRKHGAFLGFVMSADRIVHEYEEQRFVPAVWDGRTYRFYDPVENNDFWFTSPDPGPRPFPRRIGE